MTTKFIRLLCDGCGRTSDWTYKLRKGVMWFLDTPCCYYCGTKAPVREIPHDQR